MPDHPSDPRTDALAGEALTWRIQGMDCASCVAKVRTAVERLPGISGVEVNLMAERLTLRRAADGAGAEAVERQIEAVGYQATRVAVPRSAAAEGRGQGGHDHDDGHGGNGHDGHKHGDGGHDDHDQAAHGAPGGSHAGHMHAHSETEEAEERAGVPWWRTSKARLAALLGGLVAVAWTLSHLFPQEAYWIYVVATLVAVFPFGRRAVALARAGTPFSIETLMVTAALGAVVIGAAEEAAFVVVLFAVGELLENVAAGQARAGIKALADLIPRTARVERGGAVVDLPADRLAVGDVVQVRPGDRIPCDGLILEGQSAIDESPVTGESVPVSRGPGEPVVAASVNTAALLRVRVTAAASDNTISRIVRMVEDATASRAPTQRFIEKFSTYWTPGAMLVALLVILVPPLLLGGDWWTWIYRGLSVLLIACPCALVISVPAAMASGLSAGARRGLLIKGGAALEAIGGARTVAFDKTGTLTAGRPVVTDVLAMAGVDEAALLRAAAGVEAGLRAMGIASVMLTGDNERTGRAIASGLGMDVRAGLLPEQKLRDIEALKAAGPVAMVGDGINDAPALAAASVGIAMGGGTAVALETADAALLRERVYGVVELVALSRATMQNVKTNVAVAVGLKLVFLATTLLGITGLWPAILADTGATVLVTLNALRLLRWEPPASMGGPGNGTPMTQVVLHRAALPVGAGAAT